MYDVSRNQETEDAELLFHVSAVEPWTSYLSSPSFESEHHLSHRVTEQSSAVKD